MRKLCCFAAPFGAAVFLAVYLLPEALWLPAGGLCAASAVLGLRLKGERRLRWIIAAFGLAAGLCWSGVYTGLFHASARALAGTEGTMSAFVTGWPRPAGYGCGVTVRLLPEEGRALLRPEAFTGRAPRQVEEYLREVIDPILEANRDLLGDKAEISV